MTASKNPLVAVDTCAVLELFLAQNGTKANNVRSLFESDMYDIVIPTMVGTEIVAAKSMRQGQERAPIETAEIEMAREFLESCGAMFADLDPYVMRLAGGLGPRFVLMPPDAIVLATAISAGCEKLYTYDRQLLNCSPNLREIDVEHPPEATTIPSPQARSANSIWVPPTDID